MIGRLRGHVVSKTPPWLLLDVNGVGYELMAPMGVFYHLPENSSEVVLFTHYAHKDDSVALYGFLHETERQLFRQVQKVSGVGAKTALTLLSGVNVSEFTRLIHNGDIAALTRIPGIGKKTAERMVVELRDTLQAIPDGDNTTAISKSRNTTHALPLNEAITALQQLGYKPAEAAKMARNAMAEGDATAVIIRKALQAALR